MNKKPPSPPGGPKNPFSNLGGRGDVGKSAPQQKPAETAPRKNPFEHYKGKSSGTMVETSPGVEILSPRTAVDDYNKRIAEARSKAEESISQAGKASEFVTPDKVTSKNYRQVYAQKLAAEEAAKKARQQSPTQTLKKTQEDAAERNRQQQKKSEEQKQADTYSARARDLQGQIAYWKQQLGRDPESDRKANGNIQALMNELGGIPSAYWN